MERGLGGEVKIIRLYAKGVYMTKKQTPVVDDVKPEAETVEETPAEPQETPPLDPKELARQRSKDDLARKRRNMRQNKGKR
jgi:hypothetical protein